MQLPGISRCSFVFPNLCTFHGPPLLAIIMTQNSASSSAKFFLQLPLLAKLVTRWGLCCCSISSLFSYFQNTSFVE